MRAFRIAYDGADFRGFQRQPAVPTVEDAIFDALRALDALDATADAPPGYAAAGRTDAGVSAVAQTIAFEAPDWLAPRALNAELPAAIRAWASAEVPPAFHATHSARERTYVYHLYAPSKAADRTRSASRSVEDDESRRAVAPASRSVDDATVEAALDALSGSHDYHNLTSDDRNTERTLALAAERDGDHLVLTVTAGGFSRGLVRRLVSLVRAVGAGAAPLEKIDRVLAPEPLPGHEGVPAAAPEPLVLTDVAYPDVAFRVDDEAAAGARSIFDDRRIERRTGARVATHLRDGIGE